ncbi:MAG: hypothetical protein QNK23_18025 [Crocinitomicaceae bacterium]|nr:hypothetical protein [Crocinitomicaceae bacterium]
MASVRILKNNVNAMVFDVVEECFDIQSYNPKKADKSEALIDEAADFQDQILGKINAAKNKADYKAIIEEVEKKATSFVEKLNALN